MATMTKYDAFKNLGLTTDFSQAFGALGIETPTPIQEKVIPAVLDNHDVLVQAQTGSGKTACFVLPLIEKMNQDRSVKALILAPTRELAIQISGAFNKFTEGSKSRLKTVVIIGGESIEAQKEELQNHFDVIVATPGRLLDFVDKEDVNLKDIGYFIIDEADKILDLGFEKELNQVLEALHSKRQNMFFSATYSEKVLGIARKISDLYIKIEIEEDMPVVDNINQRAILINLEKRGQLLRHLIKNNKLKNTLIFVGNKKLCHNLAAKLKKDGISVDALHGDLSQSERNKALSDFKNKRIDFLVATDVAARGIDIDKLDLVINFDLPRSPADYIHRIGRTARRGERGESITFVTELDFDHFRLIEKRAQTQMTKEEVPGFEFTAEVKARVNGGAPVKGKKPSKKDKLRMKAALEKETDKEQSDEKSDEESYDPEEFLVDEE